jgi:type II restriction/modification system DNA methylase subunit YeeA
LKKFPYVNGGLFKDRFPVPVFKRKSRNILIECGRDLNWSEINPDIFGSMVQAVVHPDKRGGLGMHYTSVPNIMKVIQPLFLDELKAEYEQNIDNPKNLEKLLVRMSKIRIFDPACGSGNFLIISYKELRKLEMEILNTLYQAEIMTFPISHISLSQFYGIEIDDFAHGVAGLSLYIANHQMNLEFTGIF